MEHVKFRTVQIYNAYKNEITYQMKLASKVNEECHGHYFYALVVTICYASERWRELALWLYNNQLIFSCHIHLILKFHF